MVHSGVAFAPGVEVNDLLDSTAFNVAMFAMGWAVTRWMKSTDLPRRLQWCKAFTSSPRAVISLCAAKRSMSISTHEAASDTLDAALVSEPEIASRFLSPDSDNVKDLLVGLGALLTRRMSNAPVSDTPPWRRSCFQSKQSSDMSFSDYVAHVYWSCECSSPCLVLALIYLDRAVARDAKVVFNSDTCHRLFLASLVAALKFHDDDYVPYPNPHYADVGFVSVEDMNVMEKQFCKSIGWRFHIGTEEYSHYHSLLVHSSTCGPQEE
jgi:hypothetical protein